MTSLPYQFKAPHLLDEALTHRSFSRENGNSPHNERLEFLGDSVLGLVLSEYFFLKFPDLQEGRLSRMRASLVNEGSLAKVALRLDLNLHLKLGKGEGASGGALKPRLLSSTLEAFLGAVFLDGGFEEAKRVVLNVFTEELSRLSEVEFVDLDYKSQLQERVQGEFKTVPTYRHTRFTGPAHDRKFFVELVILDDVKATGEGRTKKEAEQDAAKKLLEKP